MKKLLVTLFIALQLFAMPSEDIDIKIWKRLIYDLSLKEYKIYTIDKKLKDILCKIPGITMVENCEYATLIIESKKSVVEDKKCENIPRLSNNYRLLLTHSNEIGAFFWMKGRPTIILSKPRLERFGLKVDIELQDYLEEIE